MRKKILVISVQRELYEPVWLNAPAAGYEPIVADDCHDANQIISDSPPTIVVLDSEISGSKLFIKHLRLSFYRLPIMVAVSKDYDLECLTMFEAGADDVIRTPFGVAEVFARVKALCRPVSIRVRSSFTSVGASVYLDPETRRVFVRREEKDVEVSRSPTAFAIMRELSSRPGDVVTRGEILHAVWGPATSLNERNVDVHIAGLRAALRDRDAGLDIVTVRGEGYKLTIDYNVPRDTNMK
jgi:DNA-binding response OmpR family regulator